MWRVTIAWCLLCLLPQSATGQDAAFVPVAPEASPGSLREIQLTADAQLELLDGSLGIRTAGQLRTLPCTSVAGAGRVHAITREPNGRVVVAAQHGLFVLDHEHLVLDRMDTYDGVPQGEPLGVHADGARRIWLCTRDAFGVIDARFGFGRTFTAQDGVPPPPYLAVAAGSGGEVRLTTDRGVFAYRPDVGPAPRTKTGKVEHAALRATDEGEAGFELSVEGLGGVTLRQRRQNHHLLYALPGSRLIGLRPGHHVVEVYAFDRDLRQTLVGKYSVQIPLPKAFDTRLLPFVALGAAAMLFVLAMPRRGRRRLPLAFARSALLLVLSIQVLAALLGYGRSWPFVGFSMYTENYHENSVLYQPRVRGIDERGDHVTFSDWEIGLLQDGYWQMLAEVLHGGEAERARLLDGINRRRGGRPPLVGFELADKRIRLTGTGPVDVAATVLVQWSRP